MEVEVSRKGKGLFALPIYSINLFFFQEVSLSICVCKEEGSRARGSQGRNRYRWGPYERMQLQASPNLLHYILFHFIKFDSFCLRVKSLLSVSEVVHGIKFIWICFLPIPA